MATVQIGVITVAGCTGGSPVRSEQGNVASSGSSVATQRAPVTLDTAAENSRPGVTGWQIRASHATDAITGYADRTSVLPGQPVRLFVSSPATTYTVTALRMGWYG
ncbi:MAG TPA: hypothetical protein VGJ44_01100, partial [Kribbellaceae bacterium]